VITAIYHCSIKIIKRSAGKSAVAAAAYRSGEKLTNDYDGMVHDFTKKGGIFHTEILLPTNAPKAYADRSVLWNAVEKIEKARNSQLAREIEIALPVELSLDEQTELAREFCKNTFVNNGMAADICIHNPKKENENPHAHIMLTMRPFNEDGTWGDKQKKVYVLDENGNKIYNQKKRQYKCKTAPTTDWNDKTKAEEWRAAWAKEINLALAKKTIHEKVDHRSYKRQGVDKIPTVHLGVSANQMERRGIQTEKGNVNRQIREDNRMLEKLKREIWKLEKWLSDYRVSDENNLITILTGQLAGGQDFEQTATPYLQNFRKVKSLRNIASAIAFLQENKIITADDLSEKLSADKAEYTVLSESVKAKNKRVRDVDALMKNYRIYKQYKPVYEEYINIKSEKKKSAFYNSHSAEIIHFESAKKSLPPKLMPKAWTFELEILSSDLNIEKAKVARLADNIAQMETVRLNVQYYEKSNEQQQVRSRDNGVLSL
jgi:hypothetical protein